MENGIFVHKGTHPDIDSYSAFWDNNKISQTELSAQMQKKKVTDLYVCGIAYDVCVGKQYNKHCILQQYLEFKL